jgi:hypothetical protein
VKWALVQEGLLAEATAFRDANIVDVTSYDELKQAIEEGKWAKGPWAGAWILCLLLFFADPSCTLLQDMNICFLWQGAQHQQDASIFHAEAYGELPTGQESWPV